MRLIYADAMLERLEEWNTKDKIDKALYNFALNRVMEQPTAYDIDKVVEELKESATYDTYWDDGGYSIDLYDAIEIVRRGGVDARQSKDERFKPITKV